MSDVRLLFVTIPADRADAFVTTLCEERLIACGNILPGARSHYWWQGELCHDEEAIVWMETALDRVELAMERARTLHPYEVPKIIAMTPEQVDAHYAAWVVAETRPTRTPGS